MSIQTGIELNDRFSGVLNSIISSVNLAISAMYDMQQGMNADIDTSSIAGAREEINQATAAINAMNEALNRQSISNIQTPHIEPDRVQPSVPDNWTWASDQAEAQIRDINLMMEQLGTVQGQITQKANETEVLSPQAQYDVELLENRLYDLQQLINQMGDNPIDIDSEQLAERLNRAVSAQEQLNTAMQSADVSGINEAYLNLSERINNVESLFPLDTPEPIRIPVQWETDGIEVFSSTGIERFQQEIQSANGMLEQLSATQDAIARQAYSTTLFPPESFQDLNRLAVRIDMIRNRIQQIENNQVNIGTDAANAWLEQLRSQLNMAVQEQSELNRAMENMDVSATNDAYLRLSQTVNVTERYIRDNVDEQGRFNQQIQEGISQADVLMNTIKGAVAAYVSIQSIGKALSISDELIQTTSRLDMMNDQAQTTEELVNMVYAAAQDARGSFMDMADVVARFGNNAKDAFGSSEEVVAFADLIQKQMTIAGASTQEAANAELQLSQALGSGVLRGDELNSIFEQAPNLIQNIADYLDVPIGQIREMAAEGELSADVVKAAIFASADEINAKFESMPMTWGQIWQSMQNTALIAFRPVLQRLDDIANSNTFQNFVNDAIEAMAIFSNVVLNVFELIGTVGSFIADNWSTISPIVYGVIGALAVYAAYLGIVKGLELASAAASVAYSVAMAAKIGITAALTGSTMAATAAQMGYNGALYACPIVWLIIMIIALIAVILAVCNAIADMTGIAQSGFGIITGGVFVVAAVIRNLVIGLINTLISWVVDFYNMIANFAAALGVLFNDPVAAIKVVMLSLFNFIVSVVTKAAAMLDAVFGSNLADAVSQFQGKIQAEVDATIESAGGTAANTLNPADYMLDRTDYGEAFNAGVTWGDGIADAVADFNIGDLFGRTNIPSVDDYTSGFADVIGSSGLGSGVDDIAGDTGSIKDSLDCTQEDLKYLRDIAEQEAVNRYTLAEVKVEQTNHNNINSGMDLDGVMSGLTDSVNEAIDSITEGVHE